MKREHILRFTAEELAARRARRESRSDWAKAARRPVPDGSDPDDALEPASAEWVTRDIPMPRRKEHVSLRLDADMVDWFRAKGRGYQTVINAVLRSYFKQHKR